MSGEPDPIVVCNIDGRVVIRWFAQRQLFAGLLRTTGLDDVAKLSAPGFLFEISLHDSPADARKALEDLAEQAALAAAQSRGTA